MIAYEENGTEITLDHHGKCPKCDADWSAGDIFDVLRTQDWCKNQTDEELRAYVESSYSPPYKFSRLIGVQLPYDHSEHYDGVSYWMCPDCKHQWPRFKRNENDHKNTKKQPPVEQKSAAKT